MHCAVEFPTSGAGRSREGDMPIIGEPPILKFLADMPTNVKGILFFIPLLFAIGGKAEKKKNSRKGETA